MILLLVFKRTLWGTSPRFVQALKKHLRTNIRKAARLVPSCSCLSQSHRGALWLEQTSLSSFYRSDENVLLITPEKFHRRLISELSRTSHSMARGQSTEANPNRVPFENTRWKSFTPTVIKWYSIHDWIPQQQYYDSKEHLFVNRYRSDRREWNG